MNELYIIKEEERPGFDPSHPRSKIDALDRSATVGRQVRLDLVLDELTE